MDDHDLFRTGLRNQWAVAKIRKHANHHFADIGIVLDVAHIPWGEDEPSFAARLDRIVHVHLSDTDESRIHLPLGQGRRNLVRLLGVLRAYRGAIALEGFSIEAGTELARWNKARFEELWHEAAGIGRVARGGQPAETVD